MVQGLSPAVQKDFRDDLLVANAPGFLNSDADILPVRTIGSGIARGSAKQAVKTYLAVKSAVATTYSQAVTVTANTRVWFLGAECYLDNSGKVYVEDADSGNISPSDASTVGLLFVEGEGVAAGGRHPIPPFTTYPREVKRGIRIQIVNAGTTDQMVFLYYLEERTDGQQEAL